MKFSLVMRDDLQSQTTGQLIREQLEKEGFVYDGESPKLVITIGGDGTLLEAFHQYKHCIDDVEFVGLHTGSLGFYTDWQLSEVDEMIEHILRKKYEVIEFPLVDFELEGTCGRRNQIVLNEFVLTNARKTLVIDIYIDDVFFESFRGTGLCISTPSGSTGYNKSLNGALLHPRIKAFQLAEIASINNRVYRTISSPIILAENQVLKLKVKDSKGIVLTYDHLEETFSSIDFITASLSQKKIRFARFKKREFWKRVSESFITS